MPTATVTGTLTNTGTIKTVFRVNLMVQTQYYELTARNPVVTRSVDVTLAAGGSVGVGPLSYGEALASGDYMYAWVRVDRISPDPLLAVVTTPETVKYMTYTLGQSWSGTPSIARPESVGLEGTLEIRVGEEQPTGAWFPWAVAGIGTALLLFSTRRRRGRKR